MDHTDDSSIEELYSRMCLTTEEREIFHLLVAYARCALCSDHIDMSKEEYSLEEIAKACQLPEEFCREGYEIALSMYNRGFEKDDKYYLIDDKKKGFIPGYFSEYMLFPLNRLASKLLRGNMFNDMCSRLDKKERGILTKLRVYIKNIMLCENDIYVLGRKWTLNRIAKRYKITVQDIKDAVEGNSSGIDCNDHKIRINKTANILLGCYLQKLEETLNELKDYETSKRESERKICSGLS